MGDKPWMYKTEPEVREFLLECIPDGYCFPLNPIWPVRDKGWYGVLQALRSNTAVAPSLSAWYPPDAKILEKIDQIHAVKPNGFVMLAAPPANEEQLEKTGARASKPDIALTASEKSANRGTSGRNVAKNKDRAFSAWCAEASALRLLSPQAHRVTS